MSTTTPFALDLCQKDVLLSISMFLSLKHLNELRNVSKQFSSWLSDYSSFSWKKRIELAFPSSFQEVLKEDMNEQVARLKKFDTLVESGHQVSFIQLSSLLRIESVKVIAKHQLPWSRHIIIIVYNNASVILFNSETGKDICRLDCTEMTSIDTVLFDVTSRKVGFVNRDCGKIVRYLQEADELKYEDCFNCKYLTLEHFKQDRTNLVDTVLIPQLFGDNIVVHHNYYTLTWYSLLTESKVKEIEFGSERDCTLSPVLVTSQIEPIIYASTRDTNAEFYFLHTIDCTLQSEETMKTLYSEDMGIEYDNCGDGVNHMALTETEHGRVLNIYKLGTGDRGYDAYDINTDMIVDSMHFDNFNNYKSIQYNPGTNFFSLKYGPNSDKDWDQDEVAVELEESDDDMEKVYGPDLTVGAYFTFNCNTQGGKWLNKDLFTVKGFYDMTKQVAPETKSEPHNKSTKGFKRQEKEPKTKSRQVFFSIAKRAIIGSINDDINDVFISGNKIVAFTAQGDVYCVVLDDTYYHSIETKQDDEKNDIQNDVEEPEMELVNNKKRKLSEQEAIGDESSDVEEPPKKKHKMECCCM